MGTEDPITSVRVWSCSTSCTDDLCEIITTLGNVRREMEERDRNDFIRVVMIHQEGNS